MMSFSSHSTRYRASGDLPTVGVLVVGGGNTRLQIAEELSATREVHLSIGSRQTPLPQRILQQPSLFWYLEKTGAMGGIERHADRPTIARQRHAYRLESPNPAQARTVASAGG